MRALCLLLAACGSATAAPAKPLVTGELAVVGELPAWAYAVVDGKVAVIDDGFTTATAIDATTGAKAWHVTLEAKPEGRHTMHELPSLVGAWTGATLHLIDPASGKDVAAKAPWNGDKCWPDVVRGMCAWRCECSYRAFDCATGAALGKQYEQSYMEMFPADGPPSAGCFGTGGQTFGRAGKVLVMSSDDAAPQAKSSGRITAALDATTGAERWRMTFSPSADPSRSGMSPNRATCWFSSSEAALEVVDCASGKRLWQLPGDAQSAFEMIAFVPQRGLYEQRDRRATLYDERTGKVRWRVELPASTLGWPRGIAPQLAWRFEEATQLALLDPATGKLGTPLARTKMTGVVPLTTGVVLADSTIRSYDTDGKLLATAALAKRRLVAEGDRMLAIGDADIAVLSLPDLKELGRIDGVGEARIIAPRRALVFRYDGKAIGRVIVVKLGS